MMRTPTLLLPLLFSLLALGTPTGAANGVDISDAVSESAFTCLRHLGNSFAVVRCFRSIGSVDPNCASNIHNAWNAGMQRVDIYMFPDPSKGDASGQVAALASYLSSHGISAGGSGANSFGRLWLDIEGPQYWSGSTATNVAFFNGLVAGAQSHGLPLGVYTSASQWQPIMGSSSAGSSFPLWYAHYDGRQSFSDFASFGGWTHPAIKQFNGDASACGVGYDANWMPGGLSPSATPSVPASSQPPAPASSAPAPAPASSQPPAPATSAPAASSQAPAASSQAPAPASPTTAAPASSASPTTAAPASSTSPASSSASQAASSAPASSAPAPSVSSLPSSSAASAAPSLPASSSAATAAPSDAPTPATEEPASTATPDASAAPATVPTSEAPAVLTSSSAAPATNQLLGNAQGPQDYGMDNFDSSTSGGLHASSSSSSSRLPAFGIALVVCGAALVAVTVVVVVAKQRAAAAVASAVSPQLEERLLPHEEIAETA